MSKKFGEAIKSARTARSMSQQALADLLGISKSAVYQWEKGRTKPEKPLLDQLEELLGVSIEVKVVSTDVSSLSNIGVPSSLPLLEFSMLSEIKNPVVYDNWSGERYSIDPRILSSIVFGTNERPLVITMQGEFAELAIREGDKILCTFLDRIFWDQISGVFIMLLENGNVVCKRIASSSEDTFYIQLMPENAHRMEFAHSKVKALWTVHYVVTPRVVS